MKVYSDSFTPYARLKEPSLLIALGASFCIHLLIIGLAYRYTLGIAKSVERDRSLTGIEIIFTEHMQNLPLTVEQSEQPFDELIPEQAIMDSKVDIEPASEQIAVQNQTQPVTVSDEGQAEIQQISHTDGIQTPLTERFSSTELNASLTSFMQGYRQNLNQNWLEECARFKNQHPFDECPVGQSYLTTLNPVMLQFVAKSESPEPILDGTGRFSAQESFERMTQTDIFNPHLLSEEIQLFGTGGDVVNSMVGLLSDSLGFTKRNKRLSLSVEAGFRELGLESSPELSE